MIKVIGGDFPKQLTAIYWGRIDLKTKDKKRVRYLLRSAIQDLEKVSEGWWNITYKVTMKDGKHLICSSDKKSFNKLYMEKESPDKKNAYVTKNISILQTFSFLKIASIVAIVVLLVNVIDAPKNTAPTKLSTADFKSKPQRAAQTEKITSYEDVFKDRTCCELIGMGTACGLRVEWLSKICGTEIDKLPTDRRPSAQIKCMDETTRHISFNFDKKQCDAIEERIYIRSGGDQ